MNWCCCLLVSAFTLFLLVPSQAIEEPKLSRDEVIRLADAEATKSGFELESYSVATPSYNRDKGVWIVRYDGKVGKNRAVSSAVHFLIYVNGQIRKASEFVEDVSKRKASEVVLGVPKRNYNPLYHADHPTAVSNPLPSVKPTDDPSLKRFMTDHFQLIYETKNIDSAVLALLQRKIGSRKRFAESDQPFLLSDVVPPGDETLPDRRFVLAGHDDDIWFLKYVHGGFSPYGVLVILLRANGNWRIGFTAYGESELGTLHEIREAVESGRYFRAGDWVY